MKQLDKNLDPKVLATAIHRHGWGHILSWVMETVSEVEFRRNYLQGLINMLSAVAKGATKKDLLSRLA